ncbi:unnamed protein product [marine sediment metagenome]|uniref:Uncharacterized protein n=1 Tax=marine sediment metagenome TaxID=412755 RepID=X1AIV7_9ZZZZ
MINAETYFDNFTPSFNNDRFEELMNDTPTRFVVPGFGNVQADKRFIKSILVACKLLKKELDRNNIYYGGEGSGKSHTMFQPPF